jgi:hypothetical protein
MASVPANRYDEVDSSAVKHHVIPRVISMPVGTSPTLKSAPMPLHVVSRNPSISHTKGSVTSSKNVSMISSSSGFHCQVKQNKAPSVADTGENASSGRWTASEHEAFLAGLKVYGREWKKVSVVLACSCFD